MIKAKKELDSFFSPKMTEDRAYELAMKVHDSEETAIKYVHALTKMKASKYGK